ALAVYVLYLVALFTGVPFFIGVGIAYFGRSANHGEAATHFEHQIGLFWRVVFGGILSNVLFWTGLALSSTIILAVVGVPLMIFGGIIFVWTFIMVLVRSLKGISRLNDSAPYPVPTGWGL
ncbi:MAG: hypothetical protein AAGG79_00090, partial [Pseudomonadota bacterium]